MTETFGQRLNRLRTSAGLSQADIASRLNVTVQAVSKWENDQSAPDIALLGDLATILGVSTDTLLGRGEAPRLESTENVDTGDLIARIQVLSADGDRVRINVPIDALSMATGLLGGHGSAVGNSISLDKVAEMAHKGMLGDLVDVCSEDGDLVKITVCHLNDKTPEPDENFFRSRKKSSNAQSSESDEKAKAEDKDESDSKYNTRSWGSIKDEIKDNIKAKVADAAGITLDRRKRRSSDRMDCPMDAGDIEAKLENAITEANIRVQSIANAMEAPDADIDSLTTQMVEASTRVKKLSDLEDDAEDMQSDYDDLQDEIDEALEEIRGGDGDAASLSLKIASCRKKQREIMSKLEEALKGVTDEAEDKE